ncbi:hypothetical protein ACFQY5_01370 [Paeniroseomonas aquatica]|uniref:hypothetical protein n=1 Tax=Paeniroseomonas aquatica TaxID=373043 RepID=UPI0036181B7B
MRITAVTGRILSTPFSYGNPAGRGGNLHLRAMDTLLVRVETDAGLTGWGEGFGFSSSAPRRRRWSGCWPRPASARTRRTSPG